MKTPKPPIWHRQPGESQRAFAAFCIYRDLGPTRSVDKAFRERRRDSRSSRRAYGIWTHWSTRWKWVERSAAFDEHIDSERLSAFRQRQREIGERRAEFEYQEQLRSERRVARLEGKLDQLEGLPNVDVEQEQVRPDGSVLRTKAKGLSLVSLAALLKERRELGRLAVTGVREDGQTKPVDKPPDFVVQVVADEDR